MGSLTFQQDVQAAVEALNNGGVILYPTDTIWGLGCDATNEKAVQRIYELKRRPDNKSMLVLMPNENMLERYIDEVPEVAYQLIEVSDKPLTIIYPGAKNLAPSLIANDGSLGIRIVHEHFCDELLRRFRKPLVSTSANFSGEPPAAIFADIHSELVESVDYVAHYRRDDIAPAVPSSIIKLGLGGEIQIIRK